MSELSPLAASRPPEIQQFIDFRKRNPRKFRPYDPACDGGKPVYTMPLQSNPPPTTDGIFAQTGILQRAKPYRVLDVGCGRGTFINPLLWHSGSILHGINQRKDFGNPNIRVGDIDDWENLDLLPNYDVIVCLNSLLYFTDPIATLERMYNSLAIGGVAITDTFRIRVNENQPVNPETIYRTLERADFSLLKNPILQRARKSCAQSLNGDLVFMPPIVAQRQSDSPIGFPIKYDSAREISGDPPISFNILSATEIVYRGV